MKKVRIIEIDTVDAWYEDRDGLIGLVGTVSDETDLSGVTSGAFDMLEGQTAVDADGEELSGYFYFYRVRLEEIVE